MILNQLSLRKNVSYLKIIQLESHQFEISVNEPQLDYRTCSRPILMAGWTKKGANTHYNRLRENTLLYETITLIPNQC